MRLIPLGVAVIVAALYLAGLGSAPLVDPPEGFHSAIAQGMAAGGDWITPRLNGVRYFDRPPLLYWLMSASFSVGGTTPFAARVWSALAAVACAAVTARLGVLLGGERMGLLAGLIVAANLGMFLFGRLVKPDMVFILCITLAWAGFAAAYLGRGGRRGLALFYAALGMATLAKDLLGAVGPLGAVGIFFWLTRERPLAPWWPAWGVAIFALVTLPWYVTVEVRNHGFLWYTVIDHHVLNFVLQRMFPDEDVPLSTLEFLLATTGAFLPWALAAPWAVARAFRRPWVTAVDRLWVLLAVWAVLVIGLFAISPFKLPHYGLPAFPALALLVARVWDDAIARRPGRLTTARLVLPLLALFAMSGLMALTVITGHVVVPTGAITAVDLATRNLVAQGHAPPVGLEAFSGILAVCALVFGAGALLLAVAAWRRSAELAVTAAVGVMLAFLPLAGKGMTQFARAKSMEPLTDALTGRAGASDTVVHEGPLENSGSMLLRVRRPVPVVNGLLSNLAFGATFPEGREVFWSAADLRRVWVGSGRVFLVSGVKPDASLIRQLPPGSVHLLAQAGGRRLYSNLADR